MTSTINRPEWATRYVDHEEDGTGWFERDLTTGVNVPGVVNADSGHGEGNALMILDDGAPVVDDGPTGLRFSEPSAMRQIAAHLLNAADAWQTIRDDADRRETAANLKRIMDDRGIDAAGLADRLEMDAERIEAILDQADDLTCTEVVLFCHALDAGPRELMAGRFSA